MVIVIKDCSFTNCQFTSNADADIFCNDSSFESCNFNYTTESSDRSDNRSVEAETSGTHDTHDTLNFETETPVTRANSVDSVDSNVSDNKSTNPNFNFTLDLDSLNMFKSLKVSIPPMFLPINLLRSPTPYNIYRNFPSITKL